MGKVYTDSGIALTNSSGGTVVDSFGVVSTTNFGFSFGTAGDSSNQSIANNTTGTFTNGTLSFVLDRTTLCLLNLRTNWWIVGTDSGIVTTHLRVDGTSVARGFLDRPYTSLITTSLNHVGTLGGGTHTLTASAQASASGTASLNIYSYFMSYTLLGK